MEHDERERVYGAPEYYWGTEANELAKEAVELVSPEKAGGTLIDIGAGEGRDAVFFAEEGFDVYAVDISRNGLAKADRLADKRGVEIDGIEADVNDLRSPEPMELVYSIGTVQYLRPENRERQFERFRCGTTPGGIHVFFAFVDHPEIPTPPDWTASEYFYDSGELEQCYAEWEVLDTREIVFEDDSGGEPHEHAAEVLVARKPKPTETEERTTTDEQRRRRSE